MKHFLIIWIFFFSLSVQAQSVVQVKIDVNPDLTILSDVTATNDSIPHGRHLVIYKNRTLVKGNVVDGIMDGIWKTYYMNGQQKLKGRYDMGQPHGEWILWSETGEVQAKFQFSHGKKIGHWQGHYSNHSKAIDIIYNPKGLPDQCIQYYFDDIIALNHEYTYTPKDTLTNFSYYYKNYSIFRYEQLKNGKRNGLLNTYHTNGMVWESYKYENGRLMNVLETHTRGGVPKKNEDFRNGNGTLYKYYSTGILYSKTNYKNGLKNDTIIIYDLGGKVSGTGKFTDGEATGLWKVYSKFHKLNLEIDILEDQPKHAKITLHLAAAQGEKQIGYFLNGYKHGVWSEYNAYSELTKETPFKYGMLHGTKKKFQGPKLMQSLPYTYDNKSGDHIYYNTFGEINVEEKFESESYIDTNWFRPPYEDWIIVSNDKKETHQKHLWFYPPFPGMEIVKTYEGVVDKKEAVFMVQRGIPYGYWPELVPAKFIGGNVVEKDYIRKYLTSSKKSLDHPVNGKVLVRYKVDQLGLVSEITVLKSLGFGLDEMAIDMVKAFPPLNAATYNGIPIESYVVREFDFKY